MGIFTIFTLLVWVDHIPLNTVEFGRHENLNDNCAIKESSINSFKLWPKSQKEL
jgi:hypothetical protein